MDGSLFDLNNFLMSFSVDYPTNFNFHSFIFWLESRILFSFFSIDNVYHQVKELSSFLSYFLFFIFILSRKCHSSIFSDFRHMMTRDRQSFITQFFPPLFSRSFAIWFDFAFHSWHCDVCCILCFCALLFSENPSAINFIPSILFCLRLWFSFVSRSLCILPFFLCAESFLMCIFKNASNSKGRTCLHLCMSFPSRIDCLSAFFDVCLKTKQNCFIK